MPESSASRDESILGAALPICGVAGDQQAALVGQGCFAAGDVKSTYGTGAFLVLNTAREFIPSKNRLLSTIAYQLKGEVTYALEGSILSAGAAIQWLRDGPWSHISRVGSRIPGASVTDSGGVYLIPAFTGLGAPYWDPDARAAIIGLTRASSRAQIARATLDSVAYQTYDLLDAMAADGQRPETLKVDGGMSQNGLLMQRLADVLGIPILRPSNPESHGLRRRLPSQDWAAASIARLTDIAALARTEARFEPDLPGTARDVQIAGWRQAVGRVRTI